MSLLTIANILRFFVTLDFVKRKSVLYYGKWVKCGVCGGNKWVTHEKYPFIRNCNKTNCNGLYPHDISKLRDIGGQIFDSVNHDMTDFNEL